MEVSIAGDRYGVKLGGEKGNVTAGRPTTAPTRCSAATPNACGEVHGPTIRPQRPIRQAWSPVRQVAQRPGPGHGGAARPAAACGDDDDGGDEGAADEFEFFSWWTGGGDSEEQGTARPVRRGELRGRDRRLGSRRQCRHECQAVLADRLLADDPPDSYQRHAGAGAPGRDIDAGEVEDLTFLWDDEARACSRGISSALITVDDKVYSVPVNILVEDLLWYNPAVLAEAGIAAPPATSGRVPHPGGRSRRPPARSR